MPRNRDGPPAVRVYTVCDESRYLIVRNVPSLGCGEELSKLFETYGTVEDCKPMDAEDCEPFTDVYWIKFQHVNNARFAKKKLDDFVFLGNKLQVCYAPQFESLPDTKEKLEARRREVIARIRSEKVKIPGSHSHAPESPFPKHPGAMERNYMMSVQSSAFNSTAISHVSSDKDYFPSSSMNKTVRVVREKLDKLSSTDLRPNVGPPLKKKKRVDYL